MKWNSFPEDQYEQVLTDNNFQNRRIKTIFAFFINLNPRKIKLLWPILEDGFWTPDLLSIYVLCPGGNDSH